MKTVKVSTTFPDWPLIHQSPRSLGIWGEYQFIINEPVDEADYWVVFDGVLFEDSCRCPPEGTILLTAEPPSVKSYDDQFAKQFAVVVTAHRGLAGDRGRICPPSLPWHVGRHVDTLGNQFFDKDYDFLASCPPTPKTKQISVISSDKAFTAEHRERLHVVRALQSAFGGEIDIYGRGITDIEDKWDAIAPYKYHVVIENGAFADYWTEKISDAYLAWSYPLYMGCPNLEKYFPVQSFARLEWGNSAQAIATIRHVLDADIYAAALPYIAAAREKCLDCYNFFPYMANLCDGLVTSQRRVSMRLLPEAAFQRSRGSHPETFLQRLSKVLTRKNV